MLAAWANNTEATQLLLKAGADVNARTNDGKTALSGAIQGKHEASIELLREKGGVE